MEHNIGLFAMAFLAATALFIYFRLSSGRSSSHSDLWKNIDTVGVGADGGKLPWAIAIVRSLTSMQKTMREGYRDFSKIQKPFALPSMWVGGALVVLPPSMLSLLNRPKDELSSFNALLENAQFQYLMTDKDVWSSVLHFIPIRRELAPNKIGPLVSTMAEEWDDAFRQCWGMTSQRRVVNAWDSMVRIISHASLRIMVGTPGCKDSNYLHQSRLYANAVLVDGCFINCIPPFMRSILGPLVALRSRYHQRKLLRILVPMVEERLSRSKTTTAPAQYSETPGNVIDWLIHESSGYGPEQRTAIKISQRILALTSMFVFAIGWVFSHTILDVYCSPSKDEIVSTLEAECRRVADEHHGLSKKEAVDCLYQVDSAVRESMRLNDVMVHLLPLEVVRGAPIDLGEVGQITAGSRVRTVFPAQMIHTDPTIYPDPDHFDAFRFSRGLDNMENPRGNSKRELMTTVSPTFLPFGYGRHACPGRWFVAYMVKQCIAYVILNYDIEVTRRPGKRTSMLNFMLPPLKAEISVSRKA